MNPDHGRLEEQIEHLRQELAAVKKRSGLGKLFRATFIAVAFTILMMWIFGQKGLDKLFSQQVQTGEVITCKHCQKEISNTVAVIKVPVWRAKEYGVKRYSAYCNPCGTEQVAFTIHVKCQKCRRIHQDIVDYAARKTEPRDRSQLDGFCSDECLRAARVDQTVDKVSERTGDIIGRIGRGVAEGMNKR